MYGGRYPIPRNIYLLHNIERREARGAALQKAWYEKLSMLYVDAEGPNKGVMTVVVSTPSGSLVNCASVKI